MTGRDLTQLVLLAAIWGASFLFQRISSPEFGPAALVALRTGIAAAILLSILGLRGHMRKLSGHWPTLTILGAINTAIPFTLFALAALTLPAGMSSVLNGTVPLFTAAVGRLWFGDRLDAGRLVGLVIGFAGVLLLVRPAPGASPSVIGVAAGLGAASLYGIAAHLSRRRLQGVDPMAVAAGTQLAAALIMLGPALLLWPEQALTPRAWSSVLGLGILCTGVAYILYFRLIASIGALRTVGVTYLIPVFGMIWGALFLGERVTLLMTAGAVLILAGVAFATGALRLPGRALAQ